jgi:hypothetical protein
MRCVMWCVTRFDLTWLNILVLQVFTNLTCVPFKNAPFCLSGGDYYSCSWDEPFVHLTFACIFRKFLTYKLRWTFFFYSVILTRRRWSNGLNQVRVETETDSFSRRAYLCTSYIYELDRWSPMPCFLAGKTTLESTIRYYKQLPVVTSLTRSYMTWDLG